MNMNQTQSLIRTDGLHSFPAGGLVDVSRSTYQSTPLAVAEIRPKIFSFLGAGGTALRTQSAGNWDESHSL